ncbi:MAG: glycosyltransferase family 4 protein [Planctomycetota bacterium]
MTIEGKKHNPAAIRVLCVNLEGSIAGAEQSLLLLIRFVPKSIQIFAACPAGVLAGKLSGLGVRTCNISAPPRKSNHLFIWLFYLAFVNLQLILIVFKTRPHIIHANNTKAVLATILPKVFAGSKLIWHMRDLRCSRLLAGICRCLSSKVIAVSKAVKEKLVGLGVKAKHIEVIYNGIATDDIPAEITKKDQSSSVIFANIGQFVPWKKQFLFIEAAERFLQDGSNAQFILIGDDIFARDGRHKKELINRARASPFAQNIKIIGWHDNLVSYWEQIDCLVHTADTEPFGRVIIEAMAHGVPVIAAADNGPAEIIADGKTGLLFAPDEIEELLGAMKRIYEDRELAHNLAVNARKHVICRFQAKHTAERIANVYEELIAA